MSLANIDGKLTLAEMENIMAGSGWGAREWCLTGAICGVLACTGTFNPMGVAAAACWALSC